MRQKNVRFFYFLLPILLAGFLSSCAERTPLESARATPIQHNGRVKPLDAFARQTVKFITGRETWRKKEALAVLLEALEDRPKVAGWVWIRVDLPELKDHLGLSKERLFFSFDEIHPSMEKIGSLVKSAKAKRDRDERPSRLEQKAETLYSKLAAVEALISGDTELGMRAAREKGPVSTGRIAAEVWYYKLRPFEKAAIAYLLAFILLTLPKQSPFFRRTGAVSLFLAVGFHSLGLIMRVFVLSRPPVSNMYESVVFMNWALMVFAAIFSGLRRNATALRIGAISSGFVMIYGNLLPIDSSLEVLVPVLRSNYWLTIHVMTVVSSYGAFGLAMGLGHRHLFLLRKGHWAKKAEKESAELIYRVIQLGVLLIGTGTFLGGVWANESWGRFWGWDPKETWAFITFLGYLAVVHLRYAKHLSDFALALCSVSGFLLVLMTWYGVNFVLGRGLHSYGQGSGGMIWIQIYLIAELIFLGWVFLKKIPGFSR